MYNNILKVILFSVYFFLFFLLGVGAANSKWFEKFLDYLAAGSASLLTLGYSETFDGDITVWVDQPDKVHDGLVLIGTHYIQNPAVVLVDAKGTVVHRWNLPKELYNPELDRVHDLDLESSTSIQAAVDVHLYPNGDLLVIQDVRDIANYRGQRLVLLDKDSNVKWQQIGQYHHDMQVAEDGTIYALDYKLSKDFPLVDFTEGQSELSFLNDIIVTLSPDGTIRDSISVTDALANSDFAYLIPMADLDIGPQEFEFKDGTTVLDLLHTNSVQWISPALAETSELFEPGDLLISMRGMSALAILRPSLGKIVWASRGPWRHQHYARLEKDGWIYLYDNEGSSRIINNNGTPVMEKQSRVIAFNPANLHVKHIYDDPTYHTMHSYWRGYYTLLNDGSVLISSSEQSRIVQATPDGEIVWELRGIPERDSTNVPYIKKFPSVRYYPHDYAKFLKP